MKKITRYYALSLLTFLSATPVWAVDAPLAKHVVVIVMDGLRPDTINPQDTPTLYRISQDGTNFPHHHPVYLSSTEVNGSAIATGAYPSHNGIMANKEYRPGIELLQPIATEEDAKVRKGDIVSKGKYLRLPTIAEIAEAAGKSTIVAGTKPVALLLQRAPKAQSTTVYEGKAQPEAQQQSLVTQEPAFPKIADAKKSANLEQDAWTTRVLTKRLWANGVPDLTMLWLSEPDYAQHGSGPNSATAKAALRSSDDNLAVVIDSLKAANILDSTDLLIVSDHGFSTVGRAIDLTETLKKSEINAVTKLPKTLKGDEVLIVGNGGSTCIYVPSKDAKLIQKVVQFLQKQDFTGVIFTTQAQPGTFGMDQVAINTPDAPDIVVSMHWTRELSKTGLPGIIDSEGLKRQPGQGNHTSLSPFDMHNTLLAIGPDFKAKFSDPLPTGNSDIAPTLLYLLGLPASNQMDGRVLSEAFSTSNTSLPVAQHHFVEASTEVDGHHWYQYLKSTQVNNVIYYEEGNSSPIVEKTARK